MNQDLNSAIEQISTLEMQIQRYEKNFEEHENLKWQFEEFIKEQEAERSTHEQGKRE